MGEVRQLNDATTRREEWMAVLTIVTRADSIVARA